MRAPPRSLFTQIRLLIANVRRAVGLAWRLERALTAQYVLVSLVSALLPVAIAYVGKLIVDAVVASIAAPAHPLGPPLTWVAVELGLILASHASGQYSGLLAQLLRARLALHVDRIIFEKALTLSIRHFEDPAFMDTLERARKESSWRPLEMITHGLRLAKEITTLLGFGALLAQLSPLRGAGARARGAAVLGGDALRGRAVWHQVAPHRQGAAGALPHAAPHERLARQGGEALRARPVAALAPPARCTRSSTARTAASRCAAGSRSPCSAPPAWASSTPSTSSSSPRPWSAPSRWAR
ncbi:MAG: hypothetical protein M5U28_06425 [Sandaracinaceae bacterium]|nr:hypothetical protein [Sandaracinaceae bacterium]